MWYERVTFEGWSEVTKAAFTLHGSSDPIQIFFSPMWHKLDLTHKHVSSKKAHEFHHFQIGFRPHSIMEINLQLG